MAKIVISYRRADSEAVTGRIRDRLVGHYGQDSVFMDIDSIPFGIDFRDYIKEALDQTDIVVAVMGPAWVGKIGSGPARIMEEADPVRIEVETALARGIAVIPLLIDEAVMPQPSDLPDSLKNLAFRNAAYVDSGRDFHLHMDRLIRSMDRLLGRVEETRAAATTAPAASPVGIAAVQSPPAPVQQPPQITMMAPPPPKRRWGLWIAIGIGTPLALLGILAIIGLMLPNNKPGPEVAEAPAAVKPAPPQPAPAAAPVPAPAAPVETPAAPVIRTVSVPTGCKLEGPLAFQDDFNPPAVGWEAPVSDRKFADGQMVLSPEQGKFALWLFPSLRFQDVRICATVRSPRQANQLSGWAQAAIAFAASDRDNFYIAQILLDGTFRIDRRLGGKEWVSVVPRTKSEHIRAGLDVVNELQVVIKDGGKQGEFFVNGQRVTEFRVQPPPNGGALGLFGGSEENSSTEWRFFNIAAVVPDATPPPAPSARAITAATTPMTCKAGPTTAFADDFKKVDPGWGRLPTGVSYQDGGIVLKPEAKRARPLLYLSLRYTSATACVNLAWPPGLVRDNEVMSAGIVFWAASYSDYYQVSLYRNGTFDVARQFHGSWLIVHRRTRSDSVRTAPDAVNQVKVHMAGNKATLYINNVRLAEFWGQPPSSGGAVGLYSQADNDRSTEWRFHDIAVVD